MISTRGFGARRRKLRAEIRHAKRKARELTGAKEKLLWAHILELEEQVALIDCIQVNRSLAVEALYNSPCYGPPQ